jgi:hypothetical protein
MVDVTLSVARSAGSGKGDVVADQLSGSLQHEPSEEPDRSREQRWANMFGRIEHFLLPYFGGAQVGPVQAPPEPPRAVWVCDICHQPASGHRFDSSNRGRLYCLSTPS